MNRYYLAKRLPFLIHFFCLWVVVFFLVLHDLKSKGGVGKQERLGVVGDETDTLRQHRRH